MKTAVVLGTITCTDIKNHGAHRKSFHLLGISLDTQEAIEMKHAKWAPTELHQALTPEQVAKGEEYLSIRATMCSDPKPATSSAVRRSSRSRRQRVVHNASADKAPGGNKERTGKKTVGNKREKPTRRPKESKHIRDRRKRRGPGRTLELRSDAKQNNELSSSEPSHTKGQLKKRVLTQGDSDQDTISQDHEFEGETEKMLAQKLADRREKAKLRQRRHRVLMQLNEDELMKEVTLSNDGDPISAAGFSAEMERDVYRQLLYRERKITARQNKLLLAQKLLNRNRKREREMAAFYEDRLAMVNKRHEDRLALVAKRYREEVQAKDDELLMIELGM